MPTFETPLARIAGPLATAVVLFLSLPPNADAALNPLVSRLQAATQIWRTARDAAMVRHECGTAIEKGDLAWTVDCEQDPVALGGAGTGDGEIDAELEDKLTRRTGAYLELRDKGLPSAHGIHNLCSPASDDWDDIDSCLYDVALEASKTLFRLAFNPQERPVSITELDCRRALGIRSCATFRKLIKNRAACFKRNGLLGSGDFATRYDCLAPALPPSRGRPSTGLSSIDDAIAKTINGFAAGVFADCPDDLEGIAFPDPLSDPTGGLFGRSDLAQVLLEELGALTDGVLDKLYVGPPRCGDGSVDADIGEECDDGNRASCDGCDSNCTLANCGNAVGCAADAEECDDGDAETGDGCTPACVLEYCGDGLLQPGLGELCDDGDLVPGDGCGSSCLPGT